MTEEATYRLQDFFAAIFTKDLSPESLFNMIYVVFNSITSTDKKPEGFEKVILTNIL